MLISWTLRILTWSSSLRLASVNMERTGSFQGCDYVMLTTWSWPPRSLIWNLSESSFGVPCRTRDSTSRNWWWFCGSWASKSRPSKSLQSLDLKSSNWNSHSFARLLDPFFRSWKSDFLPLFSLVVLFGFRCSASDTRDCGDILVRHLVKASLCTLDTQEGTLSLWQPDVDGAGRYHEQCRLDYEELQDIRAWSTYPFLLSGGWIRV